MSATCKFSTGNERQQRFSIRPTARLTRQAFLLAAGVLATTHVLFAQVTVPDAQVEANVLRALAGAPELATDSITTRTVYGTVTLSGSVHDEQARTKAETLAANADGVKKVVDELRLGSSPAISASAQAGQQSASPLVLLSDGTYGPAPTKDGQLVASTQAPTQATGQKPAAGTAPAAQAQRNNPDADQQLGLQMQQQTAAQNPAQAQTPASQYPAYPESQYPNAQYPNPQPQNTQPGTAQAAPRPYPTPYPRRPMYYPGYPPYPSAGAAPYAAQQGQPAVAGQPEGQPVVIPAGALLRVRINRPLASNRSQPGTTFDGIIVNDVSAGGFIAIPRGAAVQGTVIDAKSSGALTGRGEMSIQLTSVTLGGKTYSLTSDIWAHNGGDKTIETVNKTAGFGAAGAVIGALAGGGVGAAIGGGVGAAAGLGSSAASGHGQVYIPSEAIVTFHTAQPTTVATVSQQEMQRLAYGVPPGADQRPVPRPYPPVYVSPGYYPGYYPYYRPYGYGY